MSDLSPLCAARRTPGLAEGPSTRTAIAWTTGGPRRSANEKGRPKYVERPTGLKIDYLKTQPAPVLIDCTQRALGANEKCGSVKGAKTLGSAQTQNHGVGDDHQDRAIRYP
jgi:hypothetical protein